jgi:hypothetical protein
MTAGQVGVNVIKLFSFEFRQHLHKYKRLSEIMLLLVIIGKRHKQL